LRPDPVRKPRPTGTLELVAQLCSTESQMTSIARAFALDPADAASIRDTAEATIANLAKLMESDLGERGLQIFLQRVVGAAVGAGHVYSNAVSEAQRLSNPLLNDDRDEDRPGPIGFDDRAQRKREYAAARGLQARTTLAAAKGAVAAYAHAIGNEWQPYIGSNDGVQQVARGAAAAQMAAFS
jgi:hypothetical protein